MPVFGSHHRVTIVHDPGLPSETRREAMMGGDLDRKALFYLEDRVQTGDQIQYEYFDEPRVIVRVIPEQTMSGPSHWRAEMMPISEWRRRSTPAVSHVHVEGQGARININSVDQSVQQFENDSRQQAVLDILSELKRSIEHLALPAADRADAKIAAEQISMELQRTKPEKAIVWKLLERLNAVGGLAEKAAKLADVIDRSGWLS